MSRSTPLAKHRLTEIDPENKTGLCSKCERRVPVYAAGVTPNGYQQWRCSVRFLEGQQQRGPRQYLKGECERCGFVAVHPIQLDAHHRDHDHGNNEPDNVETLCANCHRLEHAKGTRESYSHGALAPTNPKRRIRA